MPEKGGVITLLIFSTTELIVPLFIKSYIDSLKRNKYHKSFDSSKGQCLHATAQHFSVSNTLRFIQLSEEWVLLAESSPFPVRCALNVNSTLFPINFLET